MPNETAKKIRDGAVVLAIVAASGFMAFFWSRAQDINELREEAANMLAVSGAALFAPTDKYSYLPEIVARHPVVVDSMLHKRDPQRILRTNTFLSQLQDSTKAAVIYILDDKGGVIASSNWHAPQSFIGHNYAFRPYFQDAVKSGSARFYGMGTTTMLPGYYVSHAIKSGDSTLGVAVIKIDMRDLDSGWGKNKGEVTVIDENGIIFLSSRPDWKYRPMYPLTAMATEQLRNTRQYDTVLKSPLPMRLLQSMASGEQIIAMTQQAAGREEETHYLLKTATLSGSDWTINVLVPMAETDARAMRVAIMAAGALALISLSFMYLQQARHRTREREKSRLALEQAHEALEQKHRELQKLSEDLRITSITDPLTGAYNRRFFFESVPKIVSAASRHAFPLSIVTIDVDYFKRINDMYGHPAGDKVLQTLTAICQESLREADVFARFGGEEFIMALPNADADAAKLVAERLRATVMAHPIEIKDATLGITISCGISQYRAGEQNVDPALKRADEALYAAKNGGRNRVVVR